MPFEGILQAMRVAGLDFIGLSDHCTDGRADFSVQWRGLHDGKLFIPGFEMKDGFMPFGVASGVVLSNQTAPAILARQIVTNGGVFFFAHPEEPRDWALPELTGMEIYNIHSDLKRQKGGLRALLPEVIVNLRQYPDHIYRKLFVRPTRFLQRWDELNRTRHITGTAGNDCHQNVGLRAVHGRRHDPDRGYEPENGRGVQAKLVHASAGAAVPGPARTGPEAVSLSARSL